VVRARADLNAGTPREASLQARVALECVLEELDPARLGALRTELEADRGSVIEAAGSALAGEPPARLQEQVASAVGRMERALRRHRARAP
ncbi:MAG TPA: hypothetical protein VGR10_05485, partial [Thermoleophilaceae bacterium]|nr:hypothetical protein [Thermoleophilaceae bacterium]